MLGALRAVQTQSSRGAIQPGFLFYQVDKPFSWDSTLLSERLKGCSAW